MPHEVKWLVPNKVIHQRLDGHIDAPEARIAMQSARDLIDESDEVLVHILSDMRTNTHMPPKIGEARQIMDILLSHPRMGWVVIYGLDNKVIGFVASIIGQMFKVRFRSFKTQAEAIEFLETRALNVPSLKPYIETLTKTD